MRVHCSVWLAYVNSTVTVRHVRTQWERPKRREFAVGQNVCVHSVLAFRQRTGQVELAGSLLERLRRCPEAHALSRVSPRVCLQMCGFITRER